MRAEKGKALKADRTARERRGFSSTDAAPFAQSNNESQCTRVIRVQLIGSNRCDAIGLTAHGTAPVLQLCWLLVAAGIDPDRPLIAYRAGTLALRVRTIGEAATLELNNKGTGFVRCRRAVRTGLPIAPKPTALAVSP